MTLLIVSVAKDTHNIFMNTFSGLIPKEDSKGGRKGTSHLTDFSEIWCVFSSLPL